MIKTDKAKRTKGYRTEQVSKATPPATRILIGIPMTGLLRSEWALARYGQIIPCNWGHNEFIQWIDQYSPINFTVADARNVVCKKLMEGNYEWLVFIDHDVVLPPNFLVMINDYMIDGKVPVMSGLYFTKSKPSEPLVYRGRGTGYYANWKIGDKVWVDAVPMGCTLIHRSIIEAMYKESPEYAVAGVPVRKVFETPMRSFWDAETEALNAQTGTEDMEFCSRVMRDGILKKAGWAEYQGKKNPFLIDTRLFCFHIDWNGDKYPMFGEQMRFVRRK
jgi:hypothetical protein